MATELQPAAAAQEPLSRGKIWTVGTLSYTTGALVILFFWLLWGDFAWSMRDRSVPSVLVLLFKKFGASDMVTGLLMGSLPSLMALLIGPIISYKSDRYRSRWGRRIPFLLIPTPIAVLAMVGLAFSPQLGELTHQWFGNRSLGQNVTTLIMLGVFWTLFEFASITANSVFGGLVNDVVPQAVLGRFFAMFRALSLIAGIIFNYWMFGSAETHSMWIFLGIGLLYGLGFTMMCVKVKEGEYPAVEYPAEEKAGFFAAALTYFKDCFSHSYYLWYFAAVTLASMAFGPVNSFSVYYAKSIDMDMGAYGKLMAITYTISLVLAYPLGALSDRFHPLRVSIAAIGIEVLAALWGGLYSYDVWSFSVAYVTHGVVAGMFFTASASLGQRLLPRARFAEMYSALTIVNCLAFVALSPLVGLFLDHVNHTYRYTFYIGLGLAVLALGALLVLHSKFMALGGPKEYQAP